MSCPALMTDDRKSLYIGKILCDANIVTVTSNSNISDCLQGR